MQPDQAEPESVLDKLEGHHIIRVHNPLSEDFVYPVGRTVPYFAEKFRDKYLDESKLRPTESSHPGVGHVQQFITLPAGQAMNLPGDAGKVVVKHLIDKILDLRGHKANKGDKFKRKQVEDEIILNVDNLRAEVTMMDPIEQFDKQIADLNAEAKPMEQTNAEQAFPGLAAEPGSTEVANPSQDSATATRQPGRPKATIAK